MPFGGALIASAAIGGGSSILGGLFGASAAKKAAKVQAANAQRVAAMAEREKGLGVAESYAGQGSANAKLADVFGQEKSALSPYLDAGSTAVKKLSSMVAPGGSLDSQFSFDPFKFSADDPSYQFRLQEGQKALERSAAARGQTFSGGTLKELTNYGQNMASTEYQHAYDRYRTAYDRARQTFDTNRTTALAPLSSLINIGQGATGMFGAAGQNFGNQSSANDINSSQYRGNLGMETAQISGNTLTGGANALAAGTVGAANALTSGFGGASNDIMTSLLLSKMLNPGVVSDGGLASGGVPSGSMPPVTLPSGVLPPP